jgi:hypothetical protein
MVVLLDALTRSSLTAFPVGFVALFVIGLALAASVDERPGETSRS